MGNELQCRTIYCAKVMCINIGAFRDSEWGYIIIDKKKCIEKNNDVNMIGLKSVIIFMIGLKSMVLFIVASSLDFSI